MTAFEGPVLTALLKTLGFPAGARQKRAASVPTDPKTPEKVDPRVARFERQIDKILDQRQAGLDDRVFLISIRKVRDAMGAKWPHTEARVHETVERIIDQHLTPRDLYIRYDDLSYLVVLSGSTKQKAQLKCTLIGEEILKRLLGRQTVSELIDIKVAKSSDGQETLFHDLPPLTSLIEGLMNTGRIDQAGAADGPAQMTSEAAQPERHQEKIEVQAAEKKGIEERTGRTRPGPVAGLFEVDYVFRPLLAVRTKVMSTFMCIPIRPRKGGFDSGYEVLGDPRNPAHILELDIQTLKAVSAALTMLNKTKKRSLLALPVHFETLADNRRRTQYVGLCAREFAGLANRVVFELVGLPNGIPQGRLLEFVSVLRPTCRAVLARFAPDHTSFPAFRTAGLHAVGIDVYSPDQGETALMAQMDRFVDAAKKSQLKAYVLGVRTISLYTTAVTNGFDYLAGYALTSVARSAEDIYAFRPEMPYLALIQAAAEGLSGRGEPGTIE